MPDLTALLYAGRLVLAGFVTLATVLTTACLTLQAMTAWDRRLGRRVTAQARRREADLFVTLDPER